MKHIQIKKICQQSSNICCIIEKHQTIKKEGKENHNLSGQKEKAMPGKRMSGKDF